MARRQSEIWRWFCRGDTAKVLARTIDSQRGAVPPGATGAVVGALVFAGRLEDAESLFLKREPSLGSAARIEARFFLAVGFTRHSDEERSLRYLLANAREGRKARDGRSRFYVYQGLGFRHFFTGEYRRGLRFAERAARTALEARFTFGKAFALELLGHCQAQSGEISSGLRQIERAIAQARLLGDGGLARSFKIAWLLYRAQFGREPRKIVAELETLADGELEAFPYSRANVLLELSRQYRIRGNLEASRAALEQASPIVYSLKHRRCAATLKLRFASLVEARGEHAQALQLTRGALGELHTRFDRALEVEVRGMEARLLHRLGLEGEARAAEAEVARLAQRQGKYVDARMRARGTGVTGSFRPGEDPLGELIDHVSEKREGAFEAVIDSGYLGLCAEALDLPRNGRTLVLRRSGEAPLLFDQGSVSLVGESCTPLMRRFLELLAKGSLSKESAIRGIWGYEYSPLRHDSLIYRLAARTRVALGPRSHWIEMTEDGYGLAPGVRLQRLGARLESSEELGPVGTSGPLDELGFRQLGILKEMRTSPFLDVKTCRKIFGVSEVTARRDLAGLTRLGELDRIGKGRAVKYRISGRRTI